MISLFFLNMLYGSMFIFAKFGMELSQPIFTTGIRMLCAGLVSLSIYVIYHRSWKSVWGISLSEWGLLFLVSLCNIYLSNTCEIWALQYLSVGKTAFIYNITPFFAALFAYLLFAQCMTWKKWLGLTLGFMGFIPMFMASCDIIDTSLKIGPFSSAEITLLIAAISSIVGWTLMKKLLQSQYFSLHTHPLAPFLLNGISLAIGGIICLIHASLYESQPYIAGDTIMPFLIISSVISLFKYLIGYNLNTYLLSRYSTTLVAFFSFTSSLCAAVLGVIFLGESISLSFIFSVLCVATGLMVFYQEELQQGYIS